MRKISLIIIVISLVSVFFLSACKKPDSENEHVGTNTNKTDEENKNLNNLLQLTDVTDGEEIAIMHTNMGDITLRFFPEQAPKAVQNFITHAKNGYYDGVIFHRVIEDFMIQGGDADGLGGKSIWGSSFSDEFSARLFNFNGALSMANAGKNTNGSQFFIVQKSKVDDDLISQMKAAGFPDAAIEEYKKVGGTPWLDGKHTVFGHVIDGMDIVNNIANVATGTGDKPIEDVIINSIDIIEYSAQK